MRISDWSSDVCSSDLRYAGCGAGCGGGQRPLTAPAAIVGGRRRDATALPSRPRRRRMAVRYVLGFPERSRRSCDRLWSCGFGLERRGRLGGGSERSEEHTSELQSLLRISYAVFCLKKQQDTDATVAGCALA